jgi:hypothetical protein
MTTKLTIAAMAAAGLLQACAGGQITDGSGNAVTGNANNNLVINFRDGAGQSYATGVDTSGYFGFDTDAPASATNNPVALLGSNFVVSVSSKDGTSGQASAPFDFSYNNASCPDHYVSGQTDKSCALFQIELLGNGASTPRAPFAGSFIGFATTIVPLTTVGWCQQARAGFGVTNMSPRYNDITLQTVSTVPNVAWGWKVTKVTPSAYTPKNVTIDAFGTIPANASGGWANGEAGGYIDIAQHFMGPDYYVYPDTVYEVSFFPGGLSSPCAPVVSTFTTSYDTVPPCVIDHNCPVDPGDGGDNGEGSCDPGIDCCAGGLCTDPGCSHVVDSDCEG